VTSLSVLGKAYVMQIGAQLCIVTSSSQFIIIIIIISQHGPGRFSCRPMSLSRRRYHKPSSLTIDDSK